MIIKGVPGDVCEDCGEYDLTEPITEQVPSVGERRWPKAPKSRSSAMPGSPGPRAGYRRPLSASSVTSAQPESYEPKRLGTRICQAPEPRTMAGIVGS